MKVLQCTSGGVDRIINNVFFEKKREMAEREDHIKQKGLSL